MELRGTIRALSDTKMNELVKGVTKIAENTAEMYGLQAKFCVYGQPYPVTLNHSKLYDWSEEVKNITHTYKKF